MNAPLTREYLDAATCDGCGQEHAHELYLHARCHPTVAPSVVYADGVLTLACDICNRPVARIAVAEATK